VKIENMILWEELNLRLGLKTATLVPEVLLLESEIIKPLDPGYKTAFHIFGF